MEAENPDQDPLERVPEEMKDYKDKFVIGLPTKPQRVYYYISTNPDFQDQFQNGFGYVFLEASAYYGAIEDFDSLRKEWSWSGKVTTAIRGKAVDLAAGDYAKHNMDKETANMDSEELIKGNYLQKEDLRQLICEVWYRKCFHQCQKVKQYLQLLIETSALRQHIWLQVKSILRSIFKAEMKNGTPSTEGGIELDPHEEHVTSEDWKDRFKF
jgi:hypothetical protein